MRARARLRFARTGSPSDPVATVGAASSDSSGGDIIAELRRVAEKHAPEGGYGETSWNAGTKTVFWNHADWTGTEEHDAAEQAFLAIDGVEGFDCASEANNPEGEGWERVWPTPGSEEAYERVLALAMRPLDVRPVEEPLVAGGDGRIKFAERALDSIDAAVRLAAPDART